MICYDRVVSSMSLFYCVLWRGLGLFYTLLNCGDFVEKSCFLFVCFSDICFVIMPDNMCSFELLTYM